MPKAGDIILTRSDTWISKLIRRYGREGDELCQVSHAGIFVCKMHVMEALWGRGVTTSKFPEDFQGCTYFVFSPKNVSDLDRERLSRRAMEFSSRGYGYVKIIGQLLDYLFKTDWFTSKLLVWDRYPYCSFIVAECYRAIGKDFGVPSKSTTPDDIWDFATLNLTPGSRIPERMRYVMIATNMSGVDVDISQQPEN